jgi:hypothetical protein
MHLLADPKFPLTTHDTLRPSIAHEINMILVLEMHIFYFRLAIFEVLQHVRLSGVVFGKRGWLATVVQETLVGRKGLDYFASGNSSLHFFMELYFYI